MADKKITRLADMKVFADPCEVADNPFTKFKGLMGRKGLPGGAGLLIKSCNSIHTFFMRFPIDVAYLGRAASPPDAYVVLAVRRELRPWRMDFPVFGARAVLELPAGGAASLVEGDLLCLS